MTPAPPLVAQALRVEPLSHLALEMRTIGANGGIQSNLENQGGAPTAADSGTHGRTSPMGTKGTVPVPTVRRRFASTVKSQGTRWILAQYTPRAKEAESQTALLLLTVLLAENGGTTGVILAMDHGRLDGMLDDRPASPLVVQARLHHQCGPTRP